MIIRSKTPSSSPLQTTNEVETKRINYQLEKLFDQESDKGKGVLEEGTEVEVNTSKEMSSDAQKKEQTTEEKGLEQAVKSHAGKMETSRQAVEDMVNNSNRVLLKISSVFPWDFFPTSIIVEETRLTIIHRQLFSSQVHSVDIKNISNVFIDNSILQKIRNAKDHGYSILQSLESENQRQGINAKNFPK